MPRLHKPKVIRPVLLLGLLLGAVGSAAAVNSDVRMHGANGDGGGCADAATPAAVPAQATTTKPATTTNHASKIKPVIGVRGGGDDGGSHAPRWHSFLPGMFR